MVVKPPSYVASASINIYSWSTAWRMMGWNPLSVMYKSLGWLLWFFFYRTTSIPLIRFEDAVKAGGMPSKKHENTELHIGSVWPQSTRLLFLRAEVGGSSWFDRDTHTNKHTHTCWRLDSSVIKLSGLHFLGRFIGLSYSVSFLQPGVKQPQLWSSASSRTDDVMTTDCKKNICAVQRGPPSAH